VRVLEVIHDYLPLHAAGSEIYTANLSRALKAAGHAVAVFTCEVDRAAPQWSLRERAHEGVPVFEGVYNRIYSDVSEHWDDPRMAEVFAGVLDRFAPDLVHVQGLQFVGGVSALRAAAGRRVPIVMTLHEYWWLCPREGLMYDLEGRACTVATPQDCSRCVDVYPIDRLRWSDAKHGGWLAPGQRPGAPDDEGQPATGRFADLGTRRWHARALAARESELAQARNHVARFIAPSRFLLERCVAAGFPRERMVQADYGFSRPATPPAPRAARAPGAPLRVAYVGTLSDYKGVEVFARAVERVEEGLTATIHGHLEWFPEVATRLRSIAARCRDRLLLAGPFEPDSRDAVLSGIDLLVVPSLWWENSPLTIHEAWQHGIPVLASDRGGMAELLAQGGGATFPPGDDLALAELLLAAASDPTQLADWAAGIPPVRSIGEDVKLLEKLARELSSGR
jgi:glycosyltransferase involved in cell wall biosynthesis